MKTPYTTTQGTSLYVPVLAPGVAPASLQGSLPSALPSRCKMLWVFFWRRFPSPPTSRPPRLPTRHRQQLQGKSMQAPHTDSDPHNGLCPGTHVQTSPDAQSTGTGRSQDGCSAPRCPVLGVGGATAWEAAQRAGGSSAELCTPVGLLFGLQRRKPRHLLEAGTVLPPAIPVIPVVSAVTPGSNRWRRATPLLRRNQAPFTGAAHALDLPGVSRPTWARTRSAAPRKPEQDFEQQDCCVRQQRDVCG